MAAIPTRRIERIALTVADLDRAGRFYAAALGFCEVSRERRSGEAFAATIGIPGARAEVLVMGLGDRQIELTAFHPAGMPYPAARSAADPWFQHFAIVVSDMNAAYAMLRATSGWTPISVHGPQQLPRETGGIVAFKFRDPDGHPLELSWFPPEIAGAWRQARSASPFLGIDHTALAVADTGASTQFYQERLGLSCTARQINRGATQAALDGRDGAIVEITSLATPEAGPHIELLCYQPRSDSGRSHVPRINDVASTRIVLAVDPIGAPQLLADPDGHLIEVRKAD